MEIVASYTTVGQRYMRQLSPPRKPNRYSNYQNKEQQGTGGYLETMGHDQIVV